MSWAISWINVVLRDEVGSSPVLRHVTKRPHHRSQPLRKLIPPRSRDQQPLLGPGHAPSSLRYAGQAG